MKPYKREAWSGKAVHAIQVECGLCSRVTEPIHIRMSEDMHSQGWRFSGKFGWLCPDCWPTRNERQVIWPNTEDR